MDFFCEYIGKNCFDFDLLDLKCIVFLLTFANVFFSEVEVFNISIFCCLFPVAAITVVIVYCGWWLGIVNFDIIGMMSYWYLVFHVFVCGHNLWFSEAEICTALTKGFSVDWSASSCNNDSGHGTELVYMKFYIIRDVVSDLADPTGIIVWCGLWIIVGAEGGSIIVRFLIIIIGEVGEVFCGCGGIRVVVYPVELSINEVADSVQGGKYRCSFGYCWYVKPVHRATYLLKWFCVFL